MAEVTEELGTLLSIVRDAITRLEEERDARAATGGPPYHVSNITYDVLGTTATLQGPGLTLRIVGDDAYETARARATDLNVAYEHGRDEERRRVLRRFIGAKDAECAVLAGRKFLGSQHQPASVAFTRESMDAECGMR